MIQLFISFEKVFNNEEKSLRYFLLALDGSPREPYYIKSIHELISQMRSTEEAKAFVENHVKKYPILIPGVYYEERIEFERWCGERRVECKN